MSKSDFVYPGGIFEGINLCELQARINRCPDYDCILFRKDEVELILEVLKKCQNERGKENVKNLLLSEAKSDNK